MKRKPGFLFLLCITTFLTIGFQCGGPDYIAIRDISKVDVFDPFTREILSIPASTSSDSIYLVISVDLDGFSLYSRGAGLMNEAWANHEDPLMANEITDIRVYCDSPLYGISSGVNLSSELLFGYPETKIPLSDFLEMMPGKGENGYWGWGEIYVFFKSRPAPGSYGFTVEMEDNNGHIFTSTAPLLEWF